MEEKRSLERIRCYYYLKVYDRLTRSDVGSVIDISMKGMRLVGENQFAADSEHQFLVKLPKGYILGDSFEIDAVVRWGKKKEDEEFFETGFEFNNAERKGVIFLKTLINDFKSNDLL